MKQRELKEKMPQVAAFIETLCNEFGKESIHGQIRKGLAGEPVFYAWENGYTVGTPYPEKLTRISWHPVTGCAMEIPKFQLFRDSAEIGVVAIVAEIQNDRK